MIGSVVPSTDLSALPAPDPTTLTPLGDTSGIDPAGTLNTVVPSTDLSALPAPDPTSLTPVGDTSQVVPGATDTAALLSATPVIHTDPSALAILDPSAPATGSLDAVASALRATAETAADPGHAAAAITTPHAVDTVNHAAGALAGVQPVSDSLATVTQPAIDTTARATDVAATTADPVAQAVSAAVQPAVHATGEAVGPVAAVAQVIGDAPAATTSPPATLGGVGQPFGDAAAPGTGIVPIGPHSLADGIGAVGSGNEAINSLPHELGSALAASTHPAAEGTAHVSAVIAGSIDGSAATAASAAGSGGLHLSVPPLDPTYLRYVGLAGLMGLMIQSAARWAEAAGGCGVPTRLALRQFRLLPCMAVGSVERIAHAALAVGSASTSGTAGHSATRSQSVRRGSRTHASPAGSGTVAHTAPGSGATQIVEVVVVTALVLLNFVLLVIRDTFRRSNGA